MTTSTRKRGLRVAAALPAAVIGALVAVPTYTAVAAPTSTVFVNELHYDNDGTDSGEAVEIAGPAGTDLSGWSIVLYNGNPADAAPSYATVALTGVIPDQQGGYGTLSFTATGLQNGSPDGLALVNGTTVEQLLSYEGVLTAADGPAAGQTSTDIGVAETSTTAVGSALQLRGTGTTYGAFTWGSATATPGQPNAGQTFGDEEPPPPTGECGDPATLIHQIQGSGDTFDPAFGGTQTVEGVVTASMLGGVFVQEEAADADTDPATSEGILAFLSGQPAPPVGNVVRVTGTVTEFGGSSPKTELTDVTLDDCGVAGTPIEPTPVSFPLGSPGEFERYEGMQVELVDELVISEYFNYDRFGEVVVAAPPNGWDRLFTPTAVVEPGAEANALAADYANRRITIDDASTQQNPSSIPHPGNGEPFSLDNRFRGGDTITGIQGIVDQGFGLYRLQPTRYGDYTATNPRPTSAPSVGGDVKVASFNVLNYFLTLDASGNRCGPQRDQDCRGADDANELERQRAKLIAAIAELDADVVGLMEMENSPGAEPAADLVAGLNEVAGAGTYDYIDTGVIGTDAIRLGFLYKPGVVEPVGDFAVLDSSDDPRFIDTLNRPMLTQTFDEVAGGGRFTVSVNHLKSKGSDCDAVGDPDTGDGQGNCNVTRTNAARAIVDYLAGDPTGSADPDHLVIGDLNSYDHEDPIRALETGGFADQVKRFGGEFAYGYVFDGQAGYLDHALANEALGPQVTGASEWHVNADEPDILDYDTTFKPDPIDALYSPDAYRSSDHDAVLVGLDLAEPNPVVLSAAADPATVTFGDSTTISGSLVDEDSGDPVAGAEVALESRAAADQPWEPTGDSATTGADGTLSFDVEPTANTDYRATFAGDGTNAAAESEAVHVDVATRVGIEPSATTIKKKQAVTFTGVVAPNHAGQAVQLAVSDGGDWQVVDTTTLDQDSFYTFRWRLPSDEKKGTYVFRVVKPADADHVEGMSPEVAVTVR